MGSSPSSQARRQFAELNPALSRLFKDPHEKQLHTRISKCAPFDSQRAISYDQRMPNAKITGLSGNEIYCMRLKGLIPSGVVIGNSIQSMGFLGGVRSAFRGIVGGEIPM